MLAVVFDLDGVLIDSEQRWDAIRRGVAESAGRPWPDGATRAMQGMSTVEWSTYLAETVGVPRSAAAVAEEVIDAMAAGYARGLPLMPGALAAVERLGARWPLGLASSSPRRIIDAVLRESGLGAHFAVSVSTEQVSAGKPSPAVYLEACRQLGVPAAAAAAVEDSSNGLRAAHAAGLAVIAVPHATYPPAPDALALADVVLHQLDDLDAAVVAGLR
jgi:HAD superfamily hydrolase (TIGR01509 family)